MPRELRTKFRRKPRATLHVALPMNILEKRAGIGRPARGRTAETAPGRPRSVGSCRGSTSGLPRSGLAAACSCWVFSARSPSPAPSSVSLCRTCRWRYSLLILLLAPPPRTPAPSSACAYTIRASLYAAAVIALGTPRRAAIRRKNAPNALFAPLQASAPPAATPVPPGSPPPCVRADFSLPPDFFGLRASPSHDPNALLVAPPAHVRAYLAEQHQRRAFLDPLDRRQVHPAHLVQRRPRVERAPRCLRRAAPAARAAAPAAPAGPASAGAPRWPCRTRRSAPGSARRSPATAAGRTGAPPATSPPAPGRSPPRSRLQRALAQLGQLCAGRARRPGWP